MNNKTVIIVPEYKEGLLAVKTVNQILEYSKNDIVLVDDGSPGESFEIVKKELGDNKRIKVLRHAVNLGKGAAMRTGVNMAWKMGADSVIFIDADGQHNPNLLPKFEEGLNVYDVVFGYRDLNSKMPWVRRTGNLIAKKILNVLFNLRRKEFLCGYLGFRKSAYEKLKWESDRYGVETEIATKVAKNNLSFLEIEIDTIYIDKYKGVSIFDALKILTRIPYWYFNK